MTPDVTYHDFLNSLGNAIVFGTLLVVVGKILTDFYFFYFLAVVIVIIITIEVYCKQHKQKVETFSKREWKVLSQAVSQQKVRRSPMLRRKIRGILHETKKEKKEIVHTGLHKRKSLDEKLLLPKTQLGDNDKKQVRSFSKLFRRNTVNNNLQVPLSTRTTTL